MGSLRLFCGDELQELFGSDQVEFLKTQYSSKIVMPNDYHTDFKKFRSTGYHGLEPRAIAARLQI
jgi:hypothetical protein